MSKQKKIAIVDDDEAVREALLFLFGVVGHDAEAFPSALTFLNASPQRFACLIVDQNMPEMSGLALARRLRTDNLSMPIMLVSTDMSPAMDALAASMGIVSMLKSPSTIIKLSPLWRARSRQASRGDGPLRQSGRRAHGIGGRLSQSLSTPRGALALRAE